MRISRRLTVSLVLLCGLASYAGAAAPPAPCASPEHRQFDFWLGDWQVHTPDRKFAGVNRIASEYRGCVIHERYATGRGYSGESLNVYDAARLWETADAKGAWSVAFDGKYTKK